MSSELRLDRFLKTYTRTTLNQACRDTERKAKHTQRPHLVVWLKRKRKWAMIQADTVALLWDTKSDTSLCRLLLQDVFQLTDGQFEDVKSALDTNTKGFQGMYRANDPTEGYALVIELPPDSTFDYRWAAGSAALAALAVAGGVWGNSRRKSASKPVGDTGSGDGEKNPEQDSCESQKNTLEQKQEKCTQSLLQSANQLHEYQSLEKQLVEDVKNLKERQEECTNSLQKSETQREERGQYEQSLKLIEQLQNEKDEFIQILKSSTTEKQQLEQERDACMRALASSTEQLETEHRLGESINRKPEDGFGQSLIQKNAQHGKEQAELVEQETQLEKEREHGQFLAEEVNRLNQQLKQQEACQQRTTRPEEQIETKEAEFQGQGKEEDCRQSLATLIEREKMLQKELEPYYVMPESIYLDRYDQATKTGTMNNLFNDVKNYPNFVGKKIIQTPNNIEHLLIAVDSFHRLTESLMRLCILYGNFMRVLKTITFTPALFNDPTSLYYNATDLGFVCAKKVFSCSAKMVITSLIIKFQDVKLENMTLLNKFPFTFTIENLFLEIGEKYDFPQSEVQNFVNVSNRIRVVVDSVEAFYVGFFDPRDKNQTFYWFLHVNKPIDIQFDNKGEGGFDIDNGAFRSCLENVYRIPNVESVYFHWDMKLKNNIGVLKTLIADNPDKPIAYYQNQFMNEPKAVNLKEWW